jgi:prepilin-type N-terminal cleavage/methylation domain-containing protein
MRISNRNRDGFTLLELMIAVGILGIGLSLVMGLFPVAMRDAHATNASQLGSLICKNGIQIAKIMLNERTDSQDPKYDFSINNSSDYGPVGTQYTTESSFAFEYNKNTKPSNRSDKTALEAGRSKYGGIVMYRRLKDSSGYQLTSISYARQDNGEILLLQSAVLATAVEIVDGVTTITGTAGIPNNSPVIFQNTGKWSRVTRIDTSDMNRKYLTSNIDFNVNDGESIFGIAEADNLVFSPALSTLVTITALRP